MNEQEAVAAIRILGAVARADGKIAEVERAALEEAMADFGYKMPAGTTIDQLLTEEINLDEQLEQVQSRIARRAVFEASIAMSLVDGSTTADENAVICRMRAAFELDAPKSILAEAYNAEYRMLGVQPIVDPELRTARIHQLRASSSAWAALLGAAPIPVVSEVGVLIMFDSVSRNIAAIWGHPLTRKERFARFGALMGIAMAQGAVHSLLKLVPGVGTVAGAVAGGVFGFTATWGIAVAVNHHFESAGKVTGAELRKVFLDARTEAKKSYTAQKPDIERARTEHADAIAALARKLDSREITVVEFEQQVAELLSR